MATYFRGSPHPALSAARLSSELSAIPRRKRDRDFIKVADDLWLPAGHSADFETLSVAFSRLYPDSVLTGWSAAVLHGISPPDGAAPELCVGPVGRRRRGLRVRRYPIPESAIEVRRGVRITSRRHTAFDLARYNNHLDGVLAVEQFYRRGFTQRELKEDVENGAGIWGISRARKVLADAHPESESSRETETRLFLRDAGFTAFVPQVRDLGYRLDLADPKTKIAVEYDGFYHDDPLQQSKDRTIAGSWLDHHRGGFQDLSPSPRRPSPAGPCRLRASGLRSSRLTAPRPGPQTPRAPTEARGANRDRGHPQKPGAPTEAARLAGPESRSTYAPSLVQSRRASRRKRAF